MLENPQLLTDSSRLRAALTDYFEVEKVEIQKWHEQDALCFVGQFNISSEEAYPKIAARFRQLQYTPFFRHQDGAAAIIAFPGIVSEKRSRWWINVVLFFVTVISMLYVGATWWGAGSTIHWWSGIPFTISLLGILLAHEFGHYFTARYFEVPATLPYLIPMPLSPFGTFGAFILMRGRIINRRALALIGAAGPLSGLVVAVPVVIIGLMLSDVQPLPTIYDLYFPPIIQTWSSPEFVYPTGYLMEGNSLLYLALKFLVFGRVLPGGGYDVFIHPVAAAGWAGLLVTALNLIPAGQLDGGHVIYALIGDKARYLSWIIIGALVILGLFYGGWFLWAILIYMFGRGHPEVLDDITPLDNTTRRVAIFTLVIAVLVFVPTPMRFVMP